MSLFEKRLQAAEARVGAGLRPFRVALMPVGHPDPDAFARQAKAQAQADRADVMIVRFVSPPQRRDGERMQ